MFLAAAHAVSTSPAMPHYPHYVRAVKAQRHRRKQPHPAELLAGLRTRANCYPRLVADHVSSLRLAAALVSFTDDHAEPYPREFFADDAAARVWRELGDEADLLDVLATPACRAQPSFLDAVLVAHAALRQIARGRDERALPSLRMTLTERLAAGQVIVPFPDHVSRGGDPLGDAYHYFAALAAGLVCAYRRRARWLGPLFFVGPELMSGVRQGIFGSRLFFGNHARIDRMALFHGLRLGA